MNKNNNNEITLNDNIKQTLKKETKKGLSIVKMKIVKRLLPVIIGTLLILLAIGVILGAPFLIQNIFNPNEEDRGTLSDEVRRIISIGEYGEYILNSNYSEQILEELENNKISNEAMGFLKEDSEKVKDMLEKYIKAEVKTMFPKTEVPENQIDGAIKIQRASVEGSGNVKDLKYVPYAEFNNMTEDNILNYFSLNPENFKLCIATTSTTTYKDNNNNIISSNVEIIREELDYQTIVQKYAMPFNFLISLHVIAQDTDFMDEFVEEVLKEELVLTYIDSESTVIIQKDYDGERVITTITERWPKGASEPVSTTTSSETIYIDNSNVTDYVSIEYFKKIVKTTTGTLEVTKVDTWWETVIKEIGTLKSKGGTTEVDGPNTFFEEYDKILETRTEPIPNSSDSLVTTKEADTYITETITTTTENKFYTVINKKRENKVDEFVQFIQENYRNVADNLESAPSMLFYLLQQFDNTQKHEQIMRYVIYVLSGVDHGVTEEDLEDFLENDFSSVGGSGDLQLALDYIAGWENVATWHYLNDDGVYDYGYSPYIYECITEDRLEFLCIADGLSKTSGNRNFGFGVMHRSNSFKYNNVERYEKYGIDIDSGAYDDIGCQLDVEIVQSVKKDIVSERIDSYKKLSEDNGLGLEYNQVTAITAVSFQYGNIGNFVQAYSTYGNTEEFRQNFVVNGCLAFLTGYNGGTKRAQGNWDLFSKGIYRLSDDTILNPNSYVSGEGEDKGKITEMQARIVEIARSQDPLGTGAGWCQMWVCRVYREAGQADISSCCASSAGEKWIVSNDQSSIPLGACVYGYSNPTVYDDVCGKDAGHVGIYIGDGEVASNVGGIRIESLESWISGFGWKGWGWNGGIDYSKEQ